MTSTQRDIEVSYDVSNEFFRLWLDENMHYTSASYLTGAETLEQAQLQKQGIPGLASTYGVTFGSFVPLTGQGIVQALKNDQAQVANIFSTDPAIATNGFVLLEDDKKLFGSQNVVPLVAKDRASQVSAALDAVSAKLTTAVLTDLLKKTDIRPVGGPEPQPTPARLPVRVRRPGEDMPTPPRPALAQNGTTQRLKDSGERSLGASVEPLISAAARRQWRGRVALSLTLGMCRDQRWGGGPRCRGSPPHSRCRVGSR